MVAYRFSWLVDDLTASRRGATDQRRNTEPGMAHDVDCADRRTRMTFATPTRQLAAIGRATQAEETPAVGIPPGPLRSNSGERRSRTTVTRCGPANYRTDRGGRLALYGKPEQTGEASDRPGPGAPRKKPG